MGDPAYPLKPWLLKNYPRGCNADEESFNVYCNKARIIVENVYGRLKARWRILCKRIDMNYSLVPHVVAACCVLHNVVESNKDKFQISWLEELGEIERHFPQPGQRERTDIGCREGYVRDIICDHLKNNFPQLTQMRI